MKYDLEERTAKFGENIVEFVKNFKKEIVFAPLLMQLVKSGTSIGANYYEANEASSKKDFQNKIFICKKEANETKYWLRMIAKAYPDNRKKIEIRNWKFFIWNKNDRK